MTLSEYIEKKKQAIAILETVKYELSNQVASKYCRAKYEATEMAIKALKQQPCEDCVSRASIKELFQEGCVMGMYDFLGIDDLPPVTPTQSWIPVSEKLPEESGNYLIYGKVVDYEENCVFIGEYDSDYEKFGYKEDIYDSETLGFLDSEFCEYDKVIAWQPLPKPYEEK